MLRCSLRPLLLLPIATILLAASPAMAQDAAMKAKAMAWALRLVAKTAPELNAYRECTRRYPLKRPATVALASVIACEHEETALAKAVKKHAGLRN
jgi:hypothetical protein